MNIIDLTAAPIIEMEYRYYYQDAREERLRGYCYDVEKEWGRPSKFVQQVVQLHFARSNSFDFDLGGWL